MNIEYGKDIIESHNQWLNEKRLKNETSIITEEPTIATELIIGTSVISDSGELLLIPCPLPPMLIKRNNNMGLFKRPLTKIDFNQFNVINDIQEMMQSNYPDWHIIDSLPNIDLLLIRNVEIFEEIRREQNPTNPYKKIVPSTYQICLAIDVRDESESMDLSKNAELMKWTNGYMLIHSSDKLYRILKEYKREDFRN